MARRCSTPSVPDIGLATRSQLAGLELTYWEQQFPYDDPWHVKPLEPAQVPSVETFLAGAEGDGDGDGLGDGDGDGLGDGDGDGVGDGRGEGDDAPPLPLLVQEPKLDWHPVPQ